MTAVYRITHDDWTAEQAYDEMKKYDFNHDRLGGPPKQKEVVFKFFEQYQKKNKKHDRQ